MSCINLKDNLRTVIANFNVSEIDNTARSPRKVT